MKVAFTIATANYLAQAKGVSQSFLEKNPDYQFRIVLLDRILDRFDEGYFLPAQIIEVEKYNIEYFDEMVARYTPFELSNAIKPFIAEDILKSNSEVAVLIYIDTDILIYDNFLEVESMLENSNIVLTPHALKPIPFDNLLPDEKAYLDIGVFNAGFWAVRNNKVTFDFLDWWKYHMRTKCFADVSRGLFVDQIWLNPVPFYFDNVYVSKNPGNNAAYWNLHERIISVREGKYYVNGSVPLIFFHFSGFDINQPEKISKYQNRFSFSNRADVISLVQDYQETLIRNEYFKFSNFAGYYKSPPVADQNPHNHLNVPMGQVKRTINFIKRVKNRVVRVVKPEKVDHKKIFSDIYENRIWGETEGAIYYSGSGSDEKYSLPYLEMVSKFIRENNIKSVVDLGCGDFRIGKRVCDKNTIDYKGVDIVPSLIKFNKEHYENEQTHFFNLNIIKDRLPSGELCLIRQVLQHLSNADIKKILKKAKKYKYLIITEHLPIEMSLTPNLDKYPDGDIRFSRGSGVYLTHPPFSKKAIEVLAVEPLEHPNSKIVTYLINQN